MRRLAKCGKDRMLFGVCCGIAKTLDLDISIVRLGFILGAIFTGSMLLWVYLVMAIVLPSDN